MTLAAIAAIAAWFGPGLRHGPKVAAPEWAAGIREGRLSSEYCISCHQEAGAQWRGSHHQLANRVVDRSHPAAHFAGQETATHGSRYRFELDAESQPKIEERRRDGTVLAHRPAMAIAEAPLRQFVIETRPGTFQATEVAWDPAKQEWFGAFGSEERNPGEWGHWTGQSMNWNSMCARCHMTAYQKGYDEAADRYRSSWVEQGIGCVQCHGPMTGHEKGGEALKGVPNFARDAPRMIQTCAGCHARVEDLTTAAPPGAKFEDHFRLQLMTDPRYYHADGQILDEVFEWGSFQHSAMGAAGVTCLDCHSAHTGKLKLPLENNSLCLQCHAPGNTRNAPVIDPTAHSFHAADSKGNRCVECHMVETTYMQRDPRRDHGFIIPDPRLKRELGIPDACTRCHADQPVDWSIAAWEKWYGPSGKAAPRRDRTRAVARAHVGEVAVVPELLRLIGTEKTPGWRASLLGLADRLAPGESAVATAARALHRETNPLVRAAAVRALARHAPSRDLVRDALNDPVRLVRLDAAWALSPELAEESPSRRELEAYLNVMSDNPVSLLRRGQDRFRRGQRDEGIADVRRAITLDPLSAPLPETLGYMFNAASRPAEAAEQFERAASLAPGAAQPAYLAALAWAEAGNALKAEAMFRESLRRDPAQGRAWYNLGLLLSQAGKVEEAIAALAAAEERDPRDPGTPYAAATILAQRGRFSEAKAAVERALAIDRNFAPALELRQQLRAAAP
jgi:predicted CXXCH cytochrome family protein